MNAIHFVQRRFTHRGETAYCWVERDERFTDRQSTVDDILSGQIDPEAITLILEVDTELGTTRDVTEDIAHECFALRDRSAGMRWELLSFLQAHGAAPIHWVA